MFKVRKQLLVSPPEMEHLFEACPDILRYLASNHCTTSSAFCLRFVNKACHEQIPLIMFNAHVSFLQEDNPEYYSFYKGLIRNYSPNLLKYAKHGSFEILKLAESEGYHLNVYVMEYAARGGQLETLKWIRSKGYKLTARVFSEAARSGNLKVLNWLMEEGCPRDSWACAEAAKKGNLELLKWLRKHECEWTVWTCMNAVKNGHFEVFKWAREQGSPWDVRVYKGLPEKHWDMLKWIEDDECSKSMEKSIAKTFVVSRFKREQLER